MAKRTDQFDNSDYYSDDPIDVIQSPSRRKFSGVIAFLLLLVGGTYLIQTTLAANIALNSGSPLEFGQGITSTVACAGSTNLTVTPSATFTNASGGGSFYFSSVTVSNIPAGCSGVDFKISAYDSSN